MHRTTTALLAALAFIGAACSSSDAPSGAPAGVTPSIAAQPQPEPDAQDPTPGAEPRSDEPAAGEDAEGATEPEPTDPPEEPTATTTPAPSPAAEPPPAAQLPDALELALEPVLEMERTVAMAVRPGSENLYLATQDGSVVEVAVDGSGVGSIVGEFLDVSGEISDGNEQGLLGLVFSPTGDEVFINLTDRDGTTHVDSWRMAGDRIDPATRRTLLSIDQPFPNHNGGHLAFGPDGYLYIAVGDGGAAGDPRGHGQNPETLLGTILRIAPTADGYEIPADNPFVNGGGRLEIFIWGARNPWRFSFDRATGDLWIGDVGQEEIEEIDVLWAAEGGGNGANLGWADVEGTQPFNDVGPPADDYVAPIHEYTHELGCSVTGGHVYRGVDVPEIAGHYIFADFCSGNVWGLRATADDGLLGVYDIEFDEFTGQITSFAEDAEGELYMLLRGRGLMRIVSAV